MHDNVSLCLRQIDRPSEFDELPQEGEHPYESCTVGGQRDVLVEEGHRLLDFSELLAQLLWILDPKYNL